MSDQPHPHDFLHAPHDSLEGLLQRGRGLGAVRAGRAPGAATPFVYDAVRRDLRWDSTDDRSLYTARLLRDLRLPLRPVLEALAGEEDTCLRAAEVLELLAVSGSTEARGGLRDHIREGEHWVEVLQSVASRWPDEWWSDLGDTARRRARALPEPPWPGAPWKRFGVPTVAVDPPRPPDRRSAVELLAEAGDPDAALGDRICALRLLGGPHHKPEPTLLAMVPDMAH
ncbi:hypothetical protein ACFV7Q_33395, partial [Streptomyces sp. NPDC059851]